MPIIHHLSLGWFMSSLGPKHYEYFIYVHQAATCCRIIQQRSKNSTLAQHTKTTFQQLINSTAKLSAERPASKHIIHSMWQHLYIMNSKATRNSAKLLKHRNSGSLHYIISSHVTNWSNRGKTESNTNIDSRRILTASSTLQLQENVFYSNAKKILGWVLKSGDNN